jgi:16S rRNA (cytosine967-C5)-methyltransferase
VDLSTSGAALPPQHFDLILADLPCTGSGTWGRTPEALYFFNQETIAKYSSLQKKIISTVIPALKKGGSLLYSTCSVFKKENEEITGFIQQNFGLQPDKVELIKGYRIKADSMFLARFRA